MNHTEMKNVKNYKIKMAPSKRFSVIMTVMASVLATLFIGLPVSAETVSQKEASKIAHNFFNQAAGQVMGAPKLVYNGRKLTTNRLFTPFYVYNNPAGGFVIISAENKTFPILGYSLKENFDPNKLGAKEEALLREYARDIEYIRYDSAIPEEAIKAWTDLPTHIDMILNAPYQATDPTFSMEEASEMLSRIEESGREDEYSSDMFTPAQWKDMIDEELTRSGSVALGIIGERTTQPVIVHGRKGDFYRLELDNRNQSLMRLMASEILSAGQLAYLANPLPLPATTEEEPPFAFYDSFIAETRASEDARAAMLEDIINPTEPLFKTIGAGRYEIEFPENISLARVYTLQGNMIERYKFKDTSTGHIDISGHPNGIYIAIFNGESGQPYGFKIVR